MGRTIITKLDPEYLNECLPHPTTNVRPVSPKVVTAVKKDLDKLFKKKKRNGIETKVQEDDLARLVVKLINDHHLCGDYKAALSQFHYDTNDDSKAKVDAMIYPKDHVPEDGRPDWTHSRMFIEFKRGGTKYDPFEDKDGKPVESDAHSRKAVREQLFAYGYNTMLFQQRTAAHALLINGREFRAMRYDRSGMIVTRKVNYVKEPKRLLDYLAVFGQLDAEGQGLDPTATLLEATSAAYKLMDEYAMDPGTDMDYAEGTVIPPYTPPVGASSSTPTTASPTPATTSSAPATASSKSVAAAAKARMASIKARLTRKQAKELAAAEEAAAQAVPEHDSDLDPEIPDDDEDPRVFKYVRTRFRESLQDGWPRYKLEVGPEKRKFLVGKPTFCSVTLFGRGTHGYVALDPKSRRFVFLKDSWRPFYEDVEPEGHYLQILGSGEARDYVPRLLCHGDVANQVAFTSYYQRYKFPPEPATGDDEPDQQEQPTSPSQPPSPPPPPAPSDGGSTDGRSDDAESDGLGPPSERNPSDPQPAEQDDHLPAFRDHRHYRLVSKDVGLSFDCIETSQQLVECLYHCLIGHGFAYTDHNLIHRDVSSGNVLIVPRLQDASGKDAGHKIVRWRGVLMDWELAKIVPVGAPDEQAENTDGKELVKVVPKKKKTEKARQPERTGTWQFMSVHYVRQQAKLPVTVADELESFFHVLLFYAVRFLRHNIEDVSNFVEQYFDCFDPVGTKKHPPLLKTTIVTGGSLEYLGEKVKFYVDNVSHLHGPFNALINRLLCLFKARYEVIGWQHTQLSGPQSLPAPQNQIAVLSAQDKLRMAELAVPFRHGPKHEIIAGTEPQARSAPSPETEKLAKDLDSHPAVATLFSWALLPHNTGLPPWPTVGDVVEDRLPDSYDPREIMHLLDRKIAKAIYDARQVTTESPFRDGEEPPHKRRRTTTATGETNIFKGAPSGSAASHASIAPKGQTAKGKGRKRRTRD
ncbi:hypothetical protein BD413DRAFT_673525 [Trametes elegans]|nr:hypothetical protein BD413DRAFT_673525 [Trametes elegans]